MSEFLHKIFNIKDIPVLMTFFGMIAAMLGGYDLMLATLLGFTVADYVSGVASAFVSKEVSSKIAAKGILKKFGMFVLVFVAVRLDVLLGISPAIRTITIGFYISVEGLSILENWTKIGLPMPDIIKDKLIQLKDAKQNDTDGSDDS